MRLPSQKSFPIKFGNLLPEFFKLSPALPVTMGVSNIRQILFAECYRLSGIDPFQKAASASALLSPTKAQTAQPMVVSYHKQSAETTLTCRCNYDLSKN